MIYPTTETLLLKNGFLVTPSGIVEGDVLIETGKIRELGTVSRAAEREIDVRGLHILPGAIDTQVHFREPGLEHKEDFETAGRAAVKGGVTAVFEMPNTNPTTTTIDALHDKIRRATGRMQCHFAFYMGATGDNNHILAQAESLLGCAGVKIFMGSSTGSLLVSDDQALETVLAQGGQRRVAIHAEDEARLIERKHIAEQAAHPSAHPLWRDEESALLATQRIVNLAHKTHRPVHVLHVSTAQEMDFLSYHKNIATTEVLVNHLTLSAPECYERLGTLAQMNPPIRDKNHQEMLWKAVNQGIVDILATDHAPHTLEEKAKPYPLSPSGMTGVQTLVPIMLNHINQGRLSLLRFVDLCCTSPARIFGLPTKGRLAVGYDADLTIIDLQAKRRLSHDWIESKCGWTPFDGMKIIGFPMGTIIDGQIVMWDDQITSAPIGKPLRVGHTKY